MTLGGTESGTMGGGGVGAVKTGAEGVCKAVCQKSSRSKEGDFLKSSPILATRRH